MGWDDQISIKEILQNHPQNILELKGRRGTFLTELIISLTFKLVVPHKGVLLGHQQKVVLDVHNYGHSYGF